MLERHESDEEGVRIEQRKGIVGTYLEEEEAAEEAGGQMERVSEHFSSQHE